MRFVALLLAAAALSAQAPPPSNFEAFDRALAESRYNDATAVVDKLLEQRTPDDGKARADAVLNSLLGRLFLAQRNQRAALTYLNHAPIAAMPTALHAATAYAHGRALELAGQRSAALAAFQAARSAATSEAQRRSATFGTARQLLADNPTAAGQEVVAIANGPATPDRWEAKFLLSLARSLAGDRQSASKLAEEAWTDAAGADLKSLAALQVAVLRAGLAAAAGDVAGERAMLLAAYGLSVRATGDLSARLPVCGDRGVRPDDYVIFGHASGPYLQRRFRSRRTASKQLPRFRMLWR